MKYYLLLLLFTSLSYSQDSIFDTSPLVTDEFVYVSTVKNVDFYYKIESSVSEFQIINIWLKTVNKDKPYKGKKGKLIYPKQYYTITYMTIYCGTNTYSQDNYITYNENGDIVSSGNKNIFNNKIFPNTIAENIKNKLCN
ncbi:MAG: hypothetical protein ACLGH8_01280 [Bacteroidia bacterium]